LLMVKYLISPNFMSMEFCHNLFRIAIVVDKNLLKDI
jgi:hypothetical protein